MSLVTATAAEKSQGFSLVELMVAILAGIIVTGAALAFTVASIKSNTDFMGSTRLVQELRNSSDFIVSELKRAGYDEEAMDYVANPTSTAVSVFAPILVDTTSVAANCVIYAYDRESGTPGVINLGNGEVRGIRRRVAAMSGGISVGVIEVGESFGTTRPACNGAGPNYSQYPVICNDATGWCPLSDPRILDVTTFTLGTAGSGTNSNGVKTIPAVSGFNAMLRREYLVTIAGSLRTDATITRSVRSNIKVRADCLRANVAVCDAAP